MKQAQDRSNVIPLHRNGATSVADKFSTGEDIGLQDKLTVYQTLNRVWRRHLTPNEGWAMLYLIDRTVGWGNESFTAMTVNVLDGDENYAGIGLPRRTYYETLASLETKGLIVRRSLRDKTKVTINVGWNPEKAAMLPIPKRLKEGQECGNRTSRSAKSASQECGNRTQNTVIGTTDNIVSVTAADAALTGQWDGEDEGKEDPHRSVEKEEARFLPQPKNPRSEQHADLQRVAPGETADLFQAVELFQAQDRAAMGKRADEAKKLRGKKEKPLRAADVELIWHHGIRESHPLQQHIVWSIKDKGMVNILIKKWEFANHGTVGTFLDYAVRNWAAIVARKLAWMTKPKAPIYPSLPFLIWRLNDFVEAWMHNEATGFVTNSDNDAYKRLIVGGSTHEEAIRELARQDAIGATRDEMAKREARVNQRERNAKAREESAMRFEKLGEKMEKGTVELPNGDHLEIKPGTERRPGQVWGHQPTVRLVRQRPPAPEAAAPPAAPTQPLPAFAPVPSWEEVQANITKQFQKPKASE